MLDIGTEKLAPEEMRGIPHHLIRHPRPEGALQRRRLRGRCGRLIEDIRARGKTPILAGGTHFYFDALLYGLPLDTPPDQDVRDALADRSTHELVQLVREKDPRRAARIEPDNRRRLIRALEIIEAHGAVPERDRTATRYPVEWVVLNPERDELRARIRARLITALSRGLIQEVKKVRAYVGDERLNELGLSTASSANICGRIQRS